MEHKRRKPVAEVRARALQPHDAVEAATLAARNAILKLGDRRAYARSAAWSRRRAGGSVDADEVVESVMSATSVGTPDADFRRVVDETIARLWKE